MGGNHDVSVSSRAVLMASYFSTSIRNKFQEISQKISKPTMINLPQKEEEILICLAGTNDVVNLWKLRELALSPGGLLTPELRKRAWPKLLSCHEQVFGKSSSTTLSTVDPSTRNIAVLKHDVGRTIWNVEEFILTSKTERNQQQAKLDAFLLEQQRLRNNDHKRVSFNPIVECLQTPPPKQPNMEEKGQQQNVPLSLEISESSDTGSPPPESIQTTPTESSCSGRDEDDNSIVSNKEEEDEFGTFSMAGETVVTLETCFTLSSRAVRWRKATRNEQKILFNVITALLRSPPPAHEAFADDRCFHYTGLQDLAALLLINLESPSLSTLVLERIATHHLRDALREDRTHLESALCQAFPPLLEWFDAKLASYLDEYGFLKAPTFARQWVACWFAQDMANVQTASRLLDVFLVSHPLMPLYVVVSFLTLYRKIVLGPHHSLSALSTVLRGLPHALTDTSVLEPAQAMQHTEEVIQQALLFMKYLPPTELVRLVRNRQADTFFEPQMFCNNHDASNSSWTHTASIPTDYALIQQAQALRSSKSATTTHEILGDDKVIDANDFPLAMAAVGVSRKRRSYVSILILSLMVLAVAVGLILSVEYQIPATLVTDSKLHRRSRQAPLYLPSQRLKHSVVQPLGPDQQPPPSNSWWSPKKRRSGKIEITAHTAEADISLLYRQKQTNVIGFPISFWLERLSLRWISMWRTLMSVFPSKST